MFYIFGTQITKWVKHTNWRTQMGQDRRLFENRRMIRDRRFGVYNKGYNGPERRNNFDRRSYSERRQEKFYFSESNPIKLVY
jgi:hypothetical protein